MKNLFGNIRQTKEQKRLLAERELLLGLIEDARRELEDSRNGFNEVSEGDLIDYFIYSNYACERRYLHLLKKYEALCTPRGA